MKFASSLIVHAIFTCYLKCLDRVVLAHPFWALATFPVYFAVLSCWTNTAPSTPSFCTFIHSCRRSTDCLQAASIAIMALPVCLLILPLSALLLICGFTIYSPRESRYRCLWLFFFCCQLGYFNPHYKCIYTHINQFEEKFQRPMPCLSHTNVFPHKLVQNVSPTCSGIIVHDDFRFVIFFLSHGCVIMMLWWKENDSLTSCWYIWYQCEVIGKTKDIRMDSSLFSTKK